MEKIRTISEQGANYKLKDGEIVGKEYPVNEFELALKKMQNKAYAYPDYGWRVHKLDNGNALLIVRKK